MAGALPHGVQGTHAAGENLVQTLDEHSIQRKETPMADINVERKQRSIWPWILGLILLALLIWLLSSMFNRNDEAAPTTEQTTTSTPAPSGSNP